ncbi:hypothetical protein BO94DRAFT_347197 [Aspergillus sclerotioniger CBS 115572]|uniref:Uncharacterized protein n=1 Tax=Aspergillus sclerotioniger CBS 115572 TaxID=1450535 RepID=A0A317X9L8_9EURO|nr:hypothetical protein BO94DRAFT_347197 [Aspergillus sclerotioniger CBS 115572]PWY93598.1 hypothetical protein BO94DRAFT_347197 [Aspergillus sclerotioniger CBS 115572]
MGKRGRGGGKILCTIRAVTGRGSAIGRCRKRPHENHSCSFGLSSSAFSSSTLLLQHRPSTSSHCGKSPVHPRAFLAGFPAHLRDSSYFRFIEIVGCLPDAVPFALTSASTGRVVKTLHRTFPSSSHLDPPGPEIKSRIPVVSRWSCHTSLLIRWLLASDFSFLGKTFFFPSFNFHVAFSRPLESTSSKGSRSPRLT